MRRGRSPSYLFIFCTRTDRDRSQRERERERESPTHQVLLDLGNVIVRGGGGGDGQFPDRSSHSRRCFFYIHVQKVFCSSLSRLYVYIYIYSIYVCMYNCCFLCVFILVLLLNLGVGPFSGPQRYTFRLLGPASKDLSTAKNDRRPISSRGTRFTPPTPGTPFHFLFLF